MNAKLQDLRPVPAQYIETYSIADEISLVDIWIILVRFKKVFLTTLLVVFLAGVLLVGFAVGEKFTMTSIIHIGMVKQDNRLVPIEAPQSVLAKLELSILPVLTRSYVEARDLKHFATSVTNPKDTNLIIISNEVDETSNETIAEFQRALVVRITGDHKKLFSQSNQEVRDALRLERKTLAELENPLKFLELTAEQRIVLKEEQQALESLTDSSLRESIKQGHKNEIEIVENKIQAYNGQIEALENQLESEIGNASRGAFRANIAENNLAINDLRNRLRELQQKLDGYERDLENQIAIQQLVVQGIENKIESIESDLKGQIAFQKAKYQSIEQVVKNEGSRASAIAEMSLEPVGLSKIAALLLVFIGAVILAFLITLIAVFREKVNERIAEGG